jgi:putative ubiquitin-RnfH superfamily antitoxin RatB of RatAB toxin-antitoxin module
VNKIEIIYALPSEQVLIECEISEFSTVREVITASNILIKYPEIDLAINSVGIFSQPANVDDEVHAGDRIEIYRPLTIDPKEARRIRALKR